MLATITKYYKENGYCIARDLLSLPALKKTWEEMDIIVIQQLQYLGISQTPTDKIAGVFEHMKLLYAKDQYRYIQSLRLFAKLFSLQALVMEKKIVDTIYDLGIHLPIFQTTPVVHVMANDLKIEGGYHGVGPHQDWPALQSGLDTITVWFPFMEVDSTNFPLEVVPGSHRRGLLPGKPSEHIYAVDPEAYQEDAFVPLEVRAGDVIFMSNFTLHRSGLQGDNRLRIACSARYENALEKTFIDRAYPSAQKKVIQRELLNPDFPNKTHFDAIFSV